MKERREEKDLYPYYYRETAEMTYGTSEEKRSLKKVALSFWIYLERGKYGRGQQLKLELPPKKPVQKVVRKGRAGYRRGNKTSFRGAEEGKKLDLSGGVALAGALRTRMKKKNKALKVDGD